MNHNMAMSQIQDMNVARSFGADGIRVEEPADLASALSVAFGSKGPVVVDVVTDIESRAPKGTLP